MTKRKHIEGHAAAMLGLFALVATGCAGQPTTPSSPFLMRSTSSPAAAHPRASESRQAAIPVETVVRASPLLSATCSPALRMLEMPRGRETDDQFVAAEASAARSWRPMPLMMASASPAFLHRTRRLHLDLVAARPSTERETPMRPEFADEPKAIQTDAN
jgi:hypothetical protein